MKKSAVGLFLLAFGGAIAVSACARVQNSGAQIHTARPVQTPIISSPAPSMAPQTEEPFVPAPTQAPETHTEVVTTPEAATTAAPSAVQTEAPAASEIPVEPTLAPPVEKKKLDSFSFADNDIVPVDLDYDGISETVSIVRDAESGAMKLVVDAENKFDISLNMEVSSLVCAYVTDFCFGDGSAELIISYVKPDGSYCTSIVGSFSSDTPVSCASFDGWVESLSDEGMRLCRTADVLGARGISMMHTYNSENGSFVPLEKEWTVYSYGQYAVLASELTALIFAEDGEEERVLEEGTLLLPTATDFYSYIDFETDEGIKGRILINYENGECFMNEGVELNSKFEELPLL